MLAIRDWPYFPFVGSTHFNLYLYTSSVSDAKQLSHAAQLIGSGDLPKVSFRKQDQATESPAALVL